MILVVGATGFLGSTICHDLLARGQAVRAVVRSTSDQQQVAGLREAGAELVTADLKDAASLQAACTGVATVISTATTVRSRAEGDGVEATDQQGQQQLVDAARDAGVAHLIYLSYSANLKTDCALTTAKRTVEQHLQRSGLAYTILRPSYFMEVWLGPALGFDPGSGSVRIYGDGTQAISWISLRDVARCAVAAVDQPAARKEIVELGGPEALSPHEVVQLAEETTGHSIAVEHVPAAALQAQHAAADDALGRSFAALMLDYASGDTIDTRRQRELFGDPEIGVRRYLNERWSGGLEARPEGQRG